MTPKKALRCSVWAIINCLLVSVSQSYGVTLNGAVDVKMMDGSGAITLSYNTPFRISVDGNRWIMSTSYLKEHVDVVGFDGTNLYDVLTYSEAAMQSVLANTKAGRIQRQQPAYISGSSYPFDAEPAACLVWLAYASGSYLSNSVDDLPNLWNHGFMDPASHAQIVTNLHLIPDSSGLPSSMDFLISSKAKALLSTNVPFLSATISQDEIDKSIKMASYFENFLRAQYKVVSTTNFQGHAFPLRFELDVFNPKGAPMETLVGGITKVSDKTPETFIPKLETEVTVRDYRFSDRARKMDMLKYSITNGVWLDRNDPVLLEKFEQQRANRPIINKSSAARTRLVFLLIIISGAPIIFGLLKSKKNPNQATTS